MGFIIIPDNMGFTDAVSKIRAHRRIGLDIEISGLDIFSSEVLLIQILAGSDIFIFDCRKLGNEVIKELAKTIKDKLIVGHNAKFDLKVIRNIAGILPKNVHDTMIAENIITNGCVQTRFPSLSSLTEKYFGIKLDKGVRDTFIDFKGNFSQEQLIYAANDVKWLLDIADKQDNIIKSQNQTRVFDLEAKLLPVIVDMELEGVLLDREKWTSLFNSSKETLSILKEEIENNIINNLAGNIDGMNAIDVLESLKIPIRLKDDKRSLKYINDEKTILSLVKKMMNINSNQQVLSILKNVYRVDNIDSTNEKILNKLQNNEIVNKILRYREEYKKISTYGMSFLDNINERTGRLHAEFNQTGTFSGRMSSKNPNLQNIISDSSYRSCFIARPGFSMITADYEQQELRMLAKYSGEKRMIDAFNNGIDLHSMTASYLYNIPIDKVTKEQRKVGKTLNFGINYGISPYGLYRNFNIPIDYARKLLDSYFNDVYPGLKLYNKVLGNIIWERGYSTTQIGRKRFFEKKTLYKDNDEYEKYKNTVMREGRNHLIQGSSADCTKTAMINIYYNNPFGKDLKILIQVHDEIVVEAKEEIAEDAMKFVTSQMIYAEQEFLEDVVPAAVNCYIDKCWRK